MDDPLNPDPLSQRGTAKSRFNYLEVDAWLDSAIYSTLEALSRWYGGFRVTMDRFGVSGFKRLAVELLSDGATFAVLGGLVLVAFARPAFEITGTTDWKSAQDYAVVFLDRAGNEIGKRGVLHSNAVPLDDIPDTLIKATVATEDRRFFEHFGIDISGTARALVENIRASGVRQGGSSLSQQLAKNLFLTNERSIERKIKEAFLALWLESHLTKQDILKLYFDRAYMGGGAFGVEAASQFYFGKSVRDVTLAESAMLAGLFKAPTKFAPHVNLPAARARANVVLSNLVDAGYLTEGQVFGARRAPATPINMAEIESPDYFLDWAFEEVKNITHGKHKVLTVKTTLDVSLQKRAETVIESALRESGEDYHAKQGALVCMEADGSVRAMVGGRDYGASQFNRATVALRQPGSSFKPFVYTTAMINGYGPDSVVPDVPITLGNWSPQNYTRSYMGPITLSTALEKSINTVAVRLAEQVGRGAIVETAHKMGIKSDLRITRALPLGVAEVTILDMVNAYAVFAAGGKEVTPHGIVEIRDAEGEVIYRHERDAAKPAQIIPERAIKNMNLMLARVVERGTGTRAQLDGVIAAGKTGTTQGYRDAWFVGFTGNYTTAVWYGNDDYSPTRGMTGGTLPTQSWHDFMSYAHAGIELRSIPGLEDVTPKTARQTIANNDDLPQSARAGTRAFALTRRAADSVRALEEQLSTTAPLQQPDTAPRALSAPQD